MLEDAVAELNEVNWYVIQLQVHKTIVPMIPISSRISSALSAIHSPIWVGVRQSVEWLARGWNSWFEARPKAGFFFFCSLSLPHWLRSGQWVPEVSAWGRADGVWGCLFSVSGSKVKNMQSFTSTTLDLHVLHACPHGITRLPLDGLLWSDIWVFFENFSRKIQVSLKSYKNNGTLCEDQCTFLIIPRSFLLNP